LKDVSRSQCRDCVLAVAPLPSHDKIGIPSAAFGTAQEPRPIDDGQPGAVLRDLSGVFELGFFTTVLLSVVTERGRGRPY